MEHPVANIMLLMGIAAAMTTAMATQMASALVAIAPLIALAGFFGTFVHHRSP
jgi:hypothetical protein